ncbi:hypothetical protein Tco_0481723 [Tanacetum coccineum]
MENLYLNQGLVSRTYSKKSLIMASTFGFKSKFFYDHVNPVTRRTIDEWAGGKLRDRNVKESWALLKDLALYDNESWYDPRDFAKPVKAITLPQDVPSTSDCHLIELENQVQCLMEAHLAPTQPTHVNKITTSCEICSGPHDTQYCMEDPKQAFVEYASSRTDEAGGEDGDVMFIEIVKTNDDSHKEEPEVGEQEVEYFDIFPTRSELAYHKYLMCGLIPSIFLRNPIITEGCPSNLKIPLLSSDLTNKIACRKFLIKNEEEIFTDTEDGVRIYPDGVASPAM